MFLNKKDVNLLYKCGLMKGDILYLYKKFKNVLLGLNEEYLNHIKSFYISEWNNTLIIFLKMSVLNDP